MKIKFNFKSTKTRKIFFQEKVYSVDMSNNQVALAEEGEEPDLYILRFESLRQENVQVALPPGKKDIKKYLMPKLNSMGINEKEYIIFYKEAGETVNPALGTKEKNVIVQLILQSELNAIKETHITYYRKGIIPFYFLLSGFTRHVYPDKKGVALFYFQPEELRVSAIFAFEGFPLEIIIDTVNTTDSDYIMRTFNYFQGKYAELGLDGLIIIHPDESVYEEIKSVLLLDLHKVTSPEHILLGYDKIVSHSLLKDKITLYANYTVTFFLITALSISLFITITQAVTLTQSITSYLHAKKQVFTTAAAVENNRKKLKKELQALLPMLSELKPYHKLLLHLPRVSTQIYQNFAATLSKLKQYLSEDTSVQAGDILISLQKNHTYLIVIKGKILSDIKKEMKTKASNLKHFVKKDLKAKIKFSRNPPRPPVTGFEITIRHGQK